MAKSKYPEIEYAHDLDNPEVLDKEYTKLKKWVKEKIKEMENEKKLKNKQSINQNIVKSSENLTKGQENARDDDKRDFGKTASTRNPTRDDENSTREPILQEAATNSIDDTNKQGKFEGYASGTTRRLENNSNLPQDERTLDNNRQCDTSKSQSTAESEERRAVGEGLKEFKAIYGIEIQANEAELKELERKVLEWKGLFSYSPSAAQSELDKFLQENIQEFRKNEGRYLESSKHKLYANFAVAIRVCQILNYEPSREKTEEIKKILGIKKLKVNAI